jgi:hypothetical protein
VGPPGKLELAELGRRGGKVRGRKQPERASDRYERMALKVLEELLTGEGTRPEPCYRLRVAHACSC